MKIIKALFATITCLVLVGLTACGPSAAAKACEPYSNVCYYDMTIEEMHEEAAEVGDKVALITYVPSVELQKEMGITNDNMLDKAQAYPDLAPSGWKISAVSGTYPNPSDDDVIMYGITFNRIDP